jgi:ribosomal protein L16/L10AE
VVVLLEKGVDSRRGGGRGSPQSVAAEVAADSIMDENLKCVKKLIPVDLEDAERHNS